MLDRIFDIVKQFGKDTVVDNPEVPNEHNNDVMAEATKTVASGLQNVMAGGGFKNILDLFKGGGSSKQSGIGGLIKNPIVSMMVGYFISKLVGKFKMSPSAATNVSSQLIPNVLNGLISRTKSTDPKDDAFDFNDLIGSLSGGNVKTSESGGGFNFQELLNKFTGGGKNSTDDEDDYEEITSQVAKGTRENQGNQSGKGGSLLDIIKGFIN